MTSFIELIEQGEVLYLIFVAVMLYYVGKMAVANNPQSIKWGYGISLLTFIAYCLYILSRDGIYGAEELLSIVFRGLIAAGMVLGGCWILLSAVSFLSSPAKQMKSSVEGHRRESQRKKEQKQQQRAEEERRRREQEQWERMAPERERQQREQEEAQRRKLNDQHQREEIRLSCQLLYDQHASELQQRFPRDRLAEYFQQYLSDDFPIEIVRQRGQLLTEMIESSLEQAGGNKQKFSSLNEIASYFQQQKTEIESLEYDEPTRQSFLISLNHQEDRAIREFLSS